MRRAPDFLLGFLLATAIGVVVLVFIVDPQTYNKICEYDQYGHERCASHNLFYVIWWYASYVINAATITAAATAAIAYFTLILKRSTDKLWNASDQQLRHAKRQEFQSRADRMADISRLTEQINIARQSANAAKESADVAKAAADHIPKLERAYVFFGMIVADEFREFKLGKAPDTSTHSSAKFVFKNHGRTPAIIEELHSNAKYWPQRAGWPPMTDTGSIIIQKGYVLSGGETVDPNHPYEIKFPVTAEELDRAERQEGYILLWGKIVYRDVFGTQHETGWCRGTQFASGGWQFAGDETLNYYT